MAPDDKAWVAVVPPLTIRTPSCGSTLFWSPVALKAQLAPLSRLVPLEVIVTVPAQLLTVLALSKVLLSVALPVLYRPPPDAEPLSAKVACSIVAVAALYRPPPDEVAVFPLNVVLLSVAVAAL